MRNIPILATFFGHVKHSTFATPTLITHCLTLGMHGSLNQDIFQKFFLSFSSPSLNSFKTTLSQECLPLIRNLCVVHGGINDVSLLSCMAAKKKKKGPRNIIMRKLEKRCNEGTPWERHDCGFVEEPKKRRKIQLHRLLYVRSCMC